MTRGNSASLCTACLTTRRLLSATATNLVPPGLNRKLSHTRHVASCYIGDVMPSQIDGSIFYTCTDVAQACAVSRQTIWRWRQDGLIPSGRTNRTRSVVFTESELNYIRAHATQPDASRDAKSRTIYLDNAASTRPLDIVRDAVMRAMDVDFGNPSSAHGTGRRARQIVEDARDQVASLAGADRSHVHFTSGALRRTTGFCKAPSAAGFAASLPLPLSILPYLA